MKEKNEFHEDNFNVEFSLEDEERHLIDFEDRRTISWDKNSFCDVFREIVRKRPNESFYFLNESILKDRAQVFQDYFDRKNDFVAYAIKANPLPRVLKVLNEAGITSFDCASIGEIIRVQELCKNPEIFFNNPSKRKPEIKLAYEKGVKHFTVDTKNEIGKIVDITDSAGDLELAVRINSQIDRNDEEAAVIPLFDKFGTDEKTGRGMLDEIVQEKFGKAGVSLHVGSQNTNSKNHAEHIKHLSEKMQDISDSIHTFNIGGGIPVFLDIPVSDDNRLLGKYLYDLRKTLQEDVSPRFSSDMKTIVEPGRALVAPSVDLAIAVNDVFQKSNGNKIIRIDDGVFTSFSDSIFHNWEYPFKVVDKNGKEVKGRLDEFFLEGRTCDSCDVIKNVFLPENISPDHYIFVPNAGAYHSSQATFFNGMKPHRYACYA